MVLWFRNCDNVSCCIVVLTTMCVLRDRRNGQPWKSHLPTDAKVCSCSWDVRSIVVTSVRSQVVMHVFLSFMNEVVPNFTRMYFADFATKDGEFGSLSASSPCHVDHVTLGRLLYPRVVARDRDVCIVEYRINPPYFMLEHKEGRWLPDWVTPTSSSNIAHLDRFARY